MGKWAIIITLVSQLGATAFHHHHENFVVRQRSSSLKSEPDEWEKNRVAARERRLSFVEKRAQKRRSMIDAQRQFRRRIVRKPAALPVTRTNFTQGEWLEGVVRKVRHNGAFVSVGGENEGFLHAKDVSDAEFVDDATRVLRPGDMVQVCVKAADGVSLSLSMIPLESTESYLAEHNDLQVDDFAVDSALEDVKIIRVTPFAAFVDIGCVVPAYLHVKDIGLLPQKRVGAKREPIIQPEPGLRIDRCWVKSVDIARNRIRITSIPPELRDDPHINPPTKYRYEQDEEGSDGWLLR